MTTNKATRAATATAELKRIYQKGGTFILLHPILTKNIFTRDGVGALFDRTGVVVSWLCAVHCLALPFALTVLPLVGLSILLDETVEWIILATSIGVAAVSLLPGYFHYHGRIRTVILFVAGFGLIFSSHVYLEDDLWTKGPFLLAGAVLISSSHLINRRLCKKCRACSEDEPK